MGQASRSAQVLLSRRRRWRKLANFDLVFLVLVLLRWAPSAFLNRFTGCLLAGAAWSEQIHVLLGEDG